MRDYQVVVTTDAEGVYRFKVDDGYLYVSGKATWLWQLRRRIRKAKRLLENMANG